MRREERGKLGAPAVLSPPWIATASEPRHGTKTAPTSPVAYSS
jgi:hypothetical protein